ncbi:MAG: hypothetical protein QXY90_01425 [Candidatus Anstonellales archaeon]
MRKKRMPLTSKGILFTSVFIVLISIMILTLMLWAEENKLNERRLSSKLKTDSIEFIFHQISDSTISNFSAVALYRSFGRLSDYEIRTNRGLEGRNVDSVKAAIASLFENGSLEIQGESFIYTPEEKSVSTLSGWFANLNKSANQLGAILSSGNLKNLEIIEQDAWTLKIRFDVDINITDFENKLFLSKTVHSEASVPIDGTPDPLIGRLYQRLYPGQDKKLYRPILHKPDVDSLDEIRPLKLVSEEEGELGRLDNGRSWFYGKVVLDPRAQPRYEDVIWLTNWISPGAGAEEVREFQEKLSRADALIIETRNFNENTGEKPFVSGTGSFRNFVNTYVLISTNVVHGNAKYHIYDIEKLRQVILCQLYVQNSGAPSFLQRFLEGGEYLSSRYGIETFLVGISFGGLRDELKETHDRYSRVDYKYLTGISGFRIKGLSGCKTPSMCNDEEAQSPIGHFSLDRQSIEFYEIDQHTMVCGEGRC